MEAKSLLLAKAEGTPGVDATPGATEVVWAENVQYTPRGEFVAGDPHMPGLGGIVGYTVAEYGELTFDVPLAPSGVLGTAPKWGLLMKACGWAETVAAGASVTYALAANPAASTSVSFSWRDDRRLSKLLWGLGRVGYMFEERKRPLLRFAFKGLRVNAADGAILAQADATWTGWPDVRPLDQARTTFTFNAQTPPLRSLSFEQSDNIVFSDRPNERRIDLAGARTWTGRLRHGEVLPSVLNPEALKTANTLVTGSLVHGTVAGSIVTLTAKGQITSDPSYSKDQGKPVVEYGFDPKPSALGVDDQIALVLT